VAMCNARECPREKRVLRAAKGVGATSGVQSTPRDERVATARRGAAAAVVAVAAAAATTAAQRPISRALA